jgi:glutamyl/glutaminyl-tRNA synthetase
MNITHVLRGHDWLPSTPIHLLVYKFLGKNPPEIGHLTDILDPEGGKLSKRKGSTSVEGLINEGYLREAILNFIMLLGWAPKDNRELFTLEEFVSTFDVKGLQKANPVFNKDKLDWFNGQYIRKLSDESLNFQFSIFSSQFKSLSQEKQMAITKLVKDRIKTLKDIDSFAGFFWNEPEVDKNLLGENHQTHLKAALAGIEQNRDLMEVVKENNFKTSDFFMDLRIAVTGSKFTPPINESMEILGKEESLKRIRKVVD